MPAIRRATGVLAGVDVRQAKEGSLAEEDEHLQSVRRWLAERLEGQLGAKLPSADFGEPAQPA